MDKIFEAMYYWDISFELILEIKKVYKVYPKLAELIQLWFDEKETEEKQRLIEALAVEVVEYYKREAKYYQSLIKGSHIDANA